MRRYGEHIVTAINRSELLYLSRDDVMRVGLSMKEIVDAVSTVLREKGEGRIEMPPKPGVHPRPDAFIHAMPAYVPALEAAGVKWVSGYPANQEKGLPYISGLLVLNDPENGLPTMVSDCTWITAMRTAAASGVAARHLVREEARVLAVLGCGVQGRTHLEALTLTVPTLDRVQAYDTSRSVLSAYAAWARETFDVEVMEADGPKNAVRGADVIVTAGPILKTPRPVILPDWIAPGALACPIDFDSYFTGAALRAADLFITDDVDQLRYYQAVGYFRDIPAVDGELGGVVARGTPAREDDRQRIVVMNLGIAIEDMAVAGLLLERATAAGIGVRLPL